MIIFAGVGMFFVLVLLFVLLYDAIRTRIILREILDDAELDLNELNELERKI